MKKKLLLADDSITIQKVVGIIFSTEEYELTMADDGDSAYSMALELIPDLVLADISMPGKDGFELCQAIKNEPSLKSTSVLLLPGAFDHFDETMAQDVCADGWLTKPFESQSLLDKVAQLIEAEPLLPDDGFEDTPESDDVAASEDPSVAEIAAADSVSESTLGLDVVDDSGVDEAVDVSTADDIWDAVSFEEEDLQGEGEDSPKDGDEDAPFVAAGFGETVVEPDMDEDVEPPNLSATVSVSEEADNGEDFVIEDIGEQEEELEEDSLEFTTDEPVSVPDESVEDDQFSSSDDVDFTSFSEEEAPAVEPVSENSLPEDAQEDTFEAVASDQEEVFPSVEEPFTPKAEETVYDLSGAEEDEDSFEFSDEPEAEEEDSFVVSDDMTPQAEEEETSLPADDDDDSFEFSDEADVEAVASFVAGDETALRDDEAPISLVDDEISEFDDEEDEEDVFDLSEEDIVEDLSEDDVVEAAAVEQSDSEDAVEIRSEELNLSEVDVVDDDGDELDLPDEEKDFNVEDVVVDVEEDGEDGVLTEEAVEVPPYDVDETDVTAESPAEVAAEANDEDDFYFDGSEEAPVAEAVAVAGAAAVATAASSFVDDEDDVSAEQVEQQLKALSDDELKEIVARVAGPIIEEMAKEMLEQISWDVVPDLAESMIKEEIRKIKQAVSQ